MHRMLGAAFVALFALRSLKSSAVHSQLTPSSDNVCVYSFTVPNWTPASSSSSSLSSTGVNCGTEKRLAEIKQLLAEQQTTVKLLQQQMATLQSSSRQEIAALLTHQSSSRQEIAALLTQVSALTRLVSSGTQSVTKSPSDETESVSDNYGNISRISSSDGGGVTYVRWGRTQCPNNVQALYNGYAAGSHYTHTGGGANYLCLHDTPEWANKIGSAPSWGTPIYGTEYEHLRVKNDPFSFENNGGQVLDEHNAPCVVCHTATRSALVMIPARRNCTVGWTKEYEGYLVSAHYTQARSQFVCLDAMPEVIAGGGADQNGALFYPVRSSCGALPCPKYVEDWRLSCVVCTK